LNLARGHPDTSPNGNEVVKSVPQAYSENQERKKLHGLYRYCTGSSACTGFYRQFSWSIVQDRQIADLLM
jgi:hypothetical protein